MNNERTYTIKQFLKLYEEAEIKTLDSLQKDLKKMGEKSDKKIDGLSTLMFSLQNVMVLSEMKKNLFGGETDND